MTTENEPGNLFINCFWLFLVVARKNKYTANGMNDSSNRETECKDTITWKRQNWTYHTSNKNIFLLCNCSSFSMAELTALVVASCGSNLQNCVRNRVTNFNLSHRFLKLYWYQVIGYKRYCTCAAFPIDFEALWLHNCNSYLNKRSRSYNRFLRGDG